MRQHEKEEEYETDPSFNATGISSDFGKWRFM
jgi:hypothetical protein